ncbi:MAG: M48 family metallopeptidase [Rhodobacterales bacterium]
MQDSLHPASGRFYDGKTARAHTVQIGFGQDELTLTAPSLHMPVHWVYGDMRKVTDVASQTGISLRVTNGLGRLDITDEALAQRLKNLAPNLSKSDIPATMWKRIGMWGAGAAVSVVLIIFVIIPALANQLATMIPVEREIALGRVSIQQIENMLGGYRNNVSLVCKGAKGRAALDKMTARLRPYVNSPYPLDIQVFNHKMPNAFAVPGGRIVLFDGLVQAADSPEEVAAVLGHEMGHVVNRDPVRLTLRSAGSVGILGLVFGDFAGGAAALAVAEQLVSANYSQAAEANADRYAYRLMANAELPTTPMADFFEKLNKKFGNQPGFLSHLASHPDLVGRAKAAKDADTIKGKAFTPILSASEWQDLRRICAKRG